MNEIKLKELLPNCEIHYFETIDSTNTFAKKLAKEGRCENTVVIANHQTNGRGRLGRTFFSPENSGIYLSIIIRPKINLEQLSLITPATAVAVTNVLIDFAKIDAKIKWVNDIFVDGKKVCGILTESAVGNNNIPEYVIIGIGINITPSKVGFPDEIKDIAGVLFEKEAPIDTETLTAKIIESVIKEAEKLPDTAFSKLYRERCFILGKEVVLSTGEEAVTITTDEKCQLTVRLHNGDIKTLATGEISIKLK